MKTVWITFICLVLFIVICFSLSACNKQVVDLTYQFNYAVIELPNGYIVEGRCQSWRDYDDSDQIQVRINDITYLVHSSDIVLMTKPLSDVMEVKEDD